MESKELKGQLYHNIAHIAENNKRAKVPKTIELIVNIPNDIL